MAVTYIFYSKKMINEQDTPCSYALEKKVIPNERNILTLYKSRIIFSRFGRTKKNSQPWEAFFCNLFFVAGPRASCYK